MAVENFLFTVILDPMTTGYIHAGAIKFLPLKHRDSFINCTTLSYSVHLKLLYRIVSDRVN